MTVAPAPARVLVVGAGTSNLKSAVAFNLAAALASAGTPTHLRDLDGASSQAVAVLAAGGSVVRLPWAAADLWLTSPAAPADRPDTAIEIVDPPPRFDAAVRALAAAAPLVLVPVDASALALRVLREVAPVVADAGGRLRVVLTRRLPRAADRWTLVDQLDALAPDALSPVTVPMARGGAPALYAPGTSAARAYARLAAEVTASLGLSSVRAGAAAPR